MKEILLLDNTLRDGGYVNDWNFGFNTINNVINGLIQARLNFIEAGLINCSVTANSDRTVNPSAQDFNEILSGCEKNLSKFIAMIKFGTCPIENIPEKEDTALDGIRLYFKKSESDLALNYCKQLKSKGYMVFVNPVALTSYNENDLHRLLQHVNKVKPYSFTIVDTLGIMYKEDLEYYFKQINSQLDNEINIGFHSHNNLSLAFANASVFANFQTSRKLIIDCSLLGMGKATGNCPTELIAEYLNQKFSTNFEIDKIKSIIQHSIKQYIKAPNPEKTLLYRISAMNKCHPDYAFYLKEKYNLSTSQIFEKLASIPDSEKYEFNQKPADNII